MSKIIKAGKGLTCGCCGNWFRTWKGYQDPDQDLGFGICESCQGLISDHEKQEAQKLIDCFRSGLTKPENLEKFNAMDWELQRALALQALEEGQITLSFVRG